VIFVKLWRCEVVEVARLVRWWEEKKAQRTNLTKNKPHKEQTSQKTNLTKNKEQTPQRAKAKKGYPFK